MIFPVLYLSNIFTAVRPRDAFTARMDYYLGSSIEVGEFGVAHVWFQRYEKAYFEKCRVLYGAFFRIGVCLLENRTAPHRRT